MRGFARGNSGESKRPERTVSHGEIDPQERVGLSLLLFILVWPTQLDPAIRTIFVCVCFCVSTSHHRTSRYVIT